MATYINDAQRALRDAYAHNFYDSYLLTRLGVAVPAVAANELLEAAKRVALIVEQIFNIPKNLLGGFFYSKYTVSQAVENLEYATKGSLTLLVHIAFTPARALCHIYNVTRFLRFNY
jgi:hypothetical protein